MKYLIGVLIFLAIVLPLTGCDYQPTSDQIQNKKQEELSKIGVEAVGLPAITHFQEKRILKDILELRDQPNLVTYTYITDLNGGLHKVCDSIGYGVPYATQFTNPQHYTWGYTDNSSGHSYWSGFLPQADPNGLFSPANADGTWVLCKVPGKSDVKPVYIEPRIVTSPFPLN